MLGMLYADAAAASTMTTFALPADITQVAAGSLRFKPLGTASDGSQTTYLATVAQPTATASASTTGPAPASTCASYPLHTPSFSSLQAAVNSDRRSGSYQCYNPSPTTRWRLDMGELHLACRTLPAYRSVHHDRH